MIGLAVLATTMLIAIVIIIILCCCKFHKEQGKV